MTPAEYVQMKAFARIDGAMLSVMWVASFACYVVGLANPMFTMVAFVLMVITPFFVCKRLGKFRDEGRGGIISMGRGWAYSIFVFFYASILMALAQYVYFAYIDQGYLMLVFSQSLSTPEMQQMLEQTGLQKTMQEGLESLAEMRPIDYALNVLTMNIMAGIVLGLPIGALMQRRQPNVLNK